MQPSSEKRIIRLQTVIIALLIGVLFIESDWFRTSVLPTVKGAQECQSVSMIQLIANPEKYDGQRVRVIGVGNLEFEDCSLSLNKEDWKFSLGNQLWLGLSPAISPAEAKQYNGEYVILEGTFDQHDHGHWGMFYGAIKNITRYEPWDVYRHAVMVTQHFDQTYSYRVEDFNDRILHEEQGLTAFPERNWLSTSVVGVSVSLGTGHCAVQTSYYDLENGYISPTYEYVLCAQGDYVLYAQQNEGKYSLTVQHIFFPSLYQKSYALEDVSPIAGDFIAACTPEPNGYAVITYFSGDQYTEKTITIPFPR